MCSTAFQFLYMTFATDKMNGQGLSKSFMPGKEDKIDAVLAIEGGI